MPRKQPTTVDAVLDYFETAPIEVANLTLRLAARAIRKREPKVETKPGPATSATPRAPRPRAPQAPPAAAAPSTASSTTQAAPPAPAGATTQAAPVGAPPAAKTAPAV